MSHEPLQISSLELQLGDKLLCRNLDLTIKPGESWGLLGRNGAGKTTLLHSILGIRKPRAGSIRIGKRDCREIPRRELATRVGMLFQEGVGSLPATVFETVMLGRHPHASSLLSDSDADIAAARRAMAAFDLSDLAERQVESLSGGEQQRLALAMLIAQQPDLYLLDEPNNHLDVAFQIRLLSAFDAIVSGAGASLLMATHDINLAARFCEYIVLLLDDGNHLTGPRDEVLTEANLSDAYHCRIRRVADGDLTLFYPD
jgi:iron complex transport system ATP-binding protein